MILQRLVTTIAQCIWPGAQTLLEQDGPQVRAPAPPLGGTSAAGAEVPIAEPGDELAAEALCQAQKLETIGRCVGEFAHDFNNLLMVIVGNLDRASRTAAPGTRAFAYLADATLATERAASLVGDILAFSRGHATVASLLDVDRVILAMRPLIASVSAGCAVDFELGCGGWLCRAEANQLENAVLNLVLNARDAMPDGGRLTITTAAAEAGTGRIGDHVVLTVSDTGAGMGPEVAARAFEPFFTTKPAGRGTGLGLAQIAGFVHRAAGSAHIDSAPGLGTRVTLLLPRAAPPESSSTPAFGLCPSPCPAPEGPAKTG